MKELTRKDYLTVKNPLIYNYENGSKYSNDHIADIKNAFSLTYNDWDGVIRWKLDKSVPRPSFLGLWKYLGYSFNYNYTFTVGLEESRCETGFYDEREDEE